MGLALRLWFFECLLKLNLGHIFEKFMLIAQSKHCLIVLIVTVTFEVLTL